MEDKSSDFEVKISVRELIEFVLRGGSIDTSIKSNVKAVEGTKAHKKLQKLGGEGYLSEVSLKIKEEVNDISFLVEGRADGIFKEDDLTYIDEIKTFSYDISSVEEPISPLHLCQAKCYGYIYSKENSLDKIGVRLTYYNIENEDIKRLKYEFSKEELKEFFFDTLKKYSIFAKYKKEWKIKRDKSIKEGNFPFESYRTGQREMAVAAYRAIRDEKKLFLKAPTGIGKTISSIFPAVKALGENLISMIFYLTAKNTTGNAAEDCLELLRSKDYFIKGIRLTAKEKVCFKEEVTCNPESCEYAKGHYDRINEAIMHILKDEEVLSKEKIIEYAKLHRVCPFEFSLDLTYFADIVICDYNYVFDPHVMLKRFFENGYIDAALLIDEVHNLPDRAREMYSEAIYKSKVMGALKYFKDSHKKLHTSLSKINKHLLKLKKSCNENGIYKSYEEDTEIVSLLRNFTSYFEAYLKEGKEIPKDILELYFNSLNFIKISEIYDKSYITYCMCEDREVMLKIYCIDPSINLKECFKKVRAAILFSATLIPVNYYKDILGEEEGDKALKFKSSFSKNNLCLLCAGVSTRFNHRSKTMPIVSEYILKAVSHKTGNYLVFFPSYKYMEDVYEITKDKVQGKILMQKSEMTEEERQKFLECFDEGNNETLLGFAVLGGVFSEGIDLKGEKLSGAIIVGVGLPKICFERDVILEYFNSKNNNGFNYAYTFPGMNKVLQAGGRVLRTEKDRGFVLLIDDRYKNTEYRDLFPEEWQHVKFLKNISELNENLKKFWSAPRL